MKIMCVFQCRYYHSIENSTLWCTFVNATDDCSMDEGFVNYINIAFCLFSPAQLPLISVLYVSFIFVYEYHSIHDINIFVNKILVLYGGHQGHPGACPLYYDCIQNKFSTSTCYGGL